MPLVFSIISFFSYRYYRAYIYYKLIFIVYESFCLTAFLALMLAYIGSSNEEQMKIMQDKDKRPLPWPFGVSLLSSKQRTETAETDEPTTRASASATGILFCLETNQCLMI